MLINLGDSVREFIETGRINNPTQDRRLPTFSRIVVQDVIIDPLFLDSAKLTYYSERFGLQNIPENALAPRNSIIGRRILDGTGINSESSMLFLPFFPAHLSLPCKPGEHMWALLAENDVVDSAFGYWFCKITELVHVDDMNHTHPPRTNEISFFPKKIDQNKLTPIYSFDNYINIVDNEGNRSKLAGSNFIAGGDDAYKVLINSDEDQGNVSRLIPRMAIPRHKKRPGDLTLEGSHNTLIALGTDRNGPVADFSNPTTYPIGQNQTAFIPSPILPASDLPFGAIDIVAGRGQTPNTAGIAVTLPTGSVNINDPWIEQVKVPYLANFTNEGDPDLINDASRIKISHKTKTDTSFNLTNFNAQFSISDSENGDPSIVIKSDKIRLIARQDVEILVTNGDNSNSDSYAAIVVKTDGNIVFKPSSTGYIKLGGDEANKAILCTDIPATPLNGTVKASPIFTTGNSVIGTSAVGQGTFASKILVTS
jgi:hypothetical protein